MNISLGKFKERGILMKVYQIRIKLYLLKDIMAQDVQIMLTRFIDKSLFAKENLGKLHNTNTYKNYCYDLLSPLEKDKIYKKGKIYTLTIRTIDEDMAEFFYEVCPNINTREFKGLTAEKRVLPRKIIEFIYTLTPMIIKAENGYWKNCMSQEEFEQRFIINLTKKINNFKGDINDKDEINMEKFYSTIEFLNKTPVPMKYKNIKLLGDKVRLAILDDEKSQEMAYLSLGVGLGEMNSRGAGFVNYRWL